jgi:predicted flap endonuclease-1-like 5' DNA nuclease
MSGRNSEISIIHTGAATYNVDGNPIKRKELPKADLNANTIKAVATKRRRSSIPEKSDQNIIGTDLQKIEGLGPVSEGLLKYLSITTIEQLANANASDLRKSLSEICTYSGLLGVEWWINQAKAQQQTV